MIRVRLFVPEDEPFIMSLAPRLMIGRPPWRDADAWLAAVRGWLRGSIDGHGSTTLVFVAEDERAERLGFATVNHTAHFNGARQAGVGELATSESAAGQGVGRALLAACEAWAREQGYSILTLTTGADNHAALGFYHHLGFQDEDVKLIKLLGDPPSQRE